MRTSVSFVNTRIEQPVHDMVSHFHQHIALNDATTLASVWFYSLCCPNLGVMTAITCTLHLSFQLCVYGEGRDM